MSIEAIIDHLPAELRARLDRDSERAKRMSGGAHLEDWLDYEVSLWGIRNQAMRAAFVNEPRGRSYNEAHGHLMQHYGFDKLDSGSVSAVLWLTDPKEKYKAEERHLTRKEILDGILKTLTPGQRSRLASPISARQRVQKRIEELERARAGNGEDKADVGKPLSKLKQTEQALAKALQEKHHLEERLKNDGSLFDLHRDRPADIARVIASSVVESTARAIAKSIYDELKRRSKPAG